MYRIEYHRLGLHTVNSTHIQAKREAIGMLLETTSPSASTTILEVPKGWMS